MGSAALAAIGVHTITAATPLSVKNLLMPMRSTPQREMVNGQETAVCVFSGQIVQFTSVDPRIQKRCCASATLFQMNSRASQRSAYTVTVLSLYCHCTVTVLSLSAAPFTHATAVRA